MKKITKHILLVEDNIGDARLIKEYLNGIDLYDFSINHVDTCEKAVTCISKNSNALDIILLDLHLPDSHGLETLEKIVFNTNHMPVSIIVLTGLSDENLGIASIEKGAQDYLVKGNYDVNTLIRSMIYSMKRKEILSIMQSMALYDDLTGVYNRRGFIEIALQQIKLLKRNKKGFIFMLADMDGLKTINDTLGHIVGNEAIKATINIFKKVFRESDIIGRIGGDEFVILINDSIEKYKEELIERINHALSEYNNEHKNKQFNLSMSIGAIYQNCSNPFTLEDLFKKADELMYEQKKIKKSK
jgi:two-component system, cell cycle response regulator